MSSSGDYYDPDYLGLEAEILRPVRPQLERDMTPSPPPPSQLAYLDSQYIPMLPLEVNGIYDPGLIFLRDIYPMLGLKQFIDQDPLDPAVQHPSGMEDKACSKSPKIFGTEGGDELAPIKEPSPKSEKVNGFTLPSISAQLGHLTQLADAATATVGDKDPSWTHRLSISQSPPILSMFQIGSASHPGTQTSPPISPNGNFRRELPSPGRVPVTAPSPYYYNSRRRPSITSDGPLYLAATPHDYSSSTTETPSTDQSASTPAGIPAGIDRMGIAELEDPNNSTLEQDWRSVRLEIPRFKQTSEIPVVKPQVAPSRIEKVQLSSYPHDSSSKIVSRMDLPLLIKGETIVSRPDSGSEENIIQHEVAQELGLVVDRSLEHQREFCVANGKPIKAIGKTATRVTFARETGTTIQCSFYVFQFLITPIIMGMAFLDSSKTLSANRHRLQPRLYQPRRPFRVCSLNNPKRRLRCLAESIPALANADTGSEIDLISPEYTAKRGFMLQDIENDESLVQFADGSTSQLSGKVTISIIVNPSSKLTRTTCLYVLHGLKCDILLGEVFLNETNVFESYGTEFEMQESDGHSDINTIVWLNKLERFFSDRKNKNTRQQRVSNTNPMNMANEQDARELHRHEEANKAISLLSPDQRAAAQAIEDQKCQDYEDAKVDSGLTNPQIGGFQCTYPGCSAQPFQTQYLLNSHTDVHLSNRPHFCPVKGCPRGEGGKGFKRKNEMIRHGLVHECPGYVCPYCVDRDHKYPRPDNLQRHVRVHHVDKDKDDPQLREVLAQRPEGPSRGRRRRGGNN